MKTTTYWLALGACFVACSVAAASHALPAGPAATTAGAPTTSPIAFPPAPTARYDVRGIFDPGLGGIVAFALKVPHGWLMQQAFTRQWDRALPSDKIFMSLTSPDKHQAITLLPEATYQYDNSPGAQQVAAFMAQHGQADPSRRTPLLPLAYIKQLVLPQLARQAATTLRLTAEHETPPKVVGQNMQQASGYVEGVLPSGRKVRLTTEIMLLTMNLNGAASGTWSALTNIVESDTNLAATVSLSELVAKSIVPNPAWQQQDNELKQRGTQQNIQQSQAEIQQGLAANAARLDASAARFRQNVASQRAQSNAINQNFRSRTQASSQVANAYADYMGDKTLYQNPDTGERFKVQSSLGHVYQDAQASTILNTNQPLNPSHVNWQELQQVELKNY